MNIIFSNDKNAKNALLLVKELQNRFVDKLNVLSSKYGENRPFKEVVWQRDEGIHGGGSRFEAEDEKLFNTASVNVSQVHYDDDENKKLQSATAISTIIHPNNPNVPSIHIHISFTQFKDGKNYYRIMADLNPSIVFDEDKDIFDNTLKKLAKDKYEEGIKQGDKYFSIPALNTHRGVSHFYLENYNTLDDKADYEFSKSFGEGIIDTYVTIIENAIKSRTTFNEADIKKQLEYHTLYLFQVLTLDRGTTAGLLVHNQNDVGIMGSLPSFIDKKLLLSWKEKVQKPQDILVQSIVDEINDKGVIDIKTKKSLAKCLREFYKNFPKALDMQAKGDETPTTIQNHKN